MLPTTTTWHGSPWGDWLCCDHRENAGEGKGETMNKIKESFVSIKNNFGILKIEEKRCRKIALNGRFSLIKNLLENLGANFKKL